MFKLFQPVDPTTKNVRIKERFANLTLSSNKKKDEDEANANVYEHNVASTTKRSLQYDNDDVPVNPLLKSSGLEDQAELMAPLQFTDCELVDDQRATSGDDELAALSQKMSHLAMQQASANDFVAETTESSTEGTLDVSHSECSVITISSSDTSPPATVDAGFDCDLVTSSIAETGETDNFILPRTLSNNCADRIEAYLRDVSQQSDDHHEQVSIDVSDEELSCEAKQLRVADADTESMTTISSPVNASISNAEKALDAKLDDTVGMSETQLSYFENDLSSQSIQRDNTMRSIHKSKCLALDETEENTRYDHDGDQSNRDETIPETASECSSKRDDNERVDDFDECIEKGGSEILSFKQLNQEVEIGRINISAKINIKIQIVDAESSESDIYEKSTNHSDGQDDIIEEQPSGTVINAVSQRRCDAKQDISAEAKMSPVAKPPDFMNGAEKLLNQLYGESWQTPEVIRTLQGCNKFEANHREAHDVNVVNEEETLDQSEINFSMFRSNVNTILDSTRLTPTKDKRALPVSTAPKTAPHKSEVLKRICSKNSKRAPQTELKKRPQAKENSKSERWRQLVDADSGSDSALNCASDDSDVNETNKSDSTWSGKSCDESSDDTDNDRKKTLAAGKNCTTRKQARARDKLVYLDLSKDEVSVLESTPQSPKANGDGKFRTHLADILRTCKAAVKSKLPATPTTSTKTKRKLFTFDILDEMHTPERPETPKLNKRTYTYDDDVDLITDDVNDNKNVSATIFQILDKRVNALKGGPIFAVTPPKSKTTITATPTSTKPKPPSLAAKLNEFDTPVSNKAQKTSAKTSDKLKHLQTPINKYGFLKSLDACVSKSLCHPDALIYRENYRAKKEELANLLYDLYNTNLFDNRLTVPLIWNKKLSNTAGRCLNKTKSGIRSCTVELSEKVLTSADRLRCTLIHELCHAATWIIDGEGGHGRIWKSWARKAMAVFPELPKIGVCHQYDIEYKYTYKCTLCDAKSHAHSKSKKVDNIRCSYCHGAIEIFLNKKDKQGNILPTPLKEPVGFAKFVKENYKQFKQPDMKHGDVMKQLSLEFATLKVTGQK